MPDFSPTPAQLADYLAGEGTQADRDQIDAWGASDPNNTAQLDTLRRAWRPLRPNRMQTDREVMVAEVLGRIGGYTREKNYGWDKTRTKGMTILGRGTLRQSFLSVSALIVATLAFVLVAHRSPKAVETTHTYVTRSGQQAMVTLLDGTRVTLAPRTTLQVVRFGTSSRMVTLDGQAYFQVTRSAGTPFLVRTGAVTTQVLGTAFLIRHYANDQQVHVAVAEGKVGVLLATKGRRPAKSPVTLTAGHVGDVTDSTVLVSTVDDLTPETDWLRGRLVFQEAPVFQVLQTLSRWYGYQFRCNDSTLPQQSVTIALDARSSSAALALLGQFLKVHMTVVGDTITLTPHSNRATKAPLRKSVYDVWIPTREVGR